MNGILCADMDNTIIYSYKRNIGENKLNVELYNGREISFISEKTHDLLKKVSEKMTIIPTSTRTEEQYNRKWKKRSRFLPGIPDESLS